MEHGLLKVVQWNKNYLSTRVIVWLWTVKNVRVNFTLGYANILCMDPKLVHVIPEHASITVSRFARFFSPHTPAARDAGDAVNVGLLWSEGRKRGSSTLLPVCGCYCCWGMWASGLCSWLWPWCVSSDWLQQCCPSSWSCAMNSDQGLYCS